MSRGRIGTLRMVLEELINSEDPEALLKLGAPKNEYSQEVKLMAGALKGKRLNANLIARTAADVFNAQFAPIIVRKPKSFIQMARKAEAVLGDTVYV